MGISPVHANRVIRSPREQGIPDLSLADFDHRYLHQSPA
jgi:hypothetical protein